MSKFPKLAAIAAACLAVGTAAHADKLGIGHPATPAEIAGWDIDVRPDGQGLPKGKGTAAQGEEIFQERCAACHGEFGEGKDRWPELAGGQGTLKADRPDKTVGSYWPYPTTIFDYIHRAMPFGNAQSLQPDELYALVAYLLLINDVIKDPQQQLDETNLAKIKMPNAEGFMDDDRETAEKSFWKKNVCMKDCKPSVAITGHASVLDVTPDAKTGPKVD